MSIPVARWCLRRFTLLLLVLGACSVLELDSSTHPCPCGDGFVCDLKTQRCVEAGLLNDAANEDASDGSAANDASSSDAANSSTDAANDASHAVGATCANARECSSGFCVDGVCCESACDGTCMSCSNRRTGVADGTCAAIPSGTDPESDCESLGCGTGVCDGEGACQARAAGYPCRGAAGACDIAETCDGVSTTCPNDALQPATMECRQSWGVCDVAENCDGVNAECPTDRFVAASTVCRASAGVCDVAESCTGSDAQCPFDAFAPETAVCRAAAGVCDAVEYCEGSDANCPNDSKLRRGTVCRPAVAACDAAEVCSGSNDCPADRYAAATQACGLYRCMGNDTLQCRASCTVDAHCASTYFCVNGACVDNGKRVFATSTSYRGGEFGGQAGADARCQEHATRAGLRGTYRAWLSSTSASALSRLSDGTNYYVGSDPGPIFMLARTRTELLLNRSGYWSSLTDELGYPARTYWWTGSDSAGATHGDTCNNWSDSTEAFRGAVGLSVVLPGNFWSNAGSSYRCSQPNTLLCIQQ